MNRRPDNFNLLTEPWIPVLWADGKFGRAGIKEALSQADRIRQIATSNPMDRVAILRFLLALLYWCRGSPPDWSGSPPAVSLSAEMFRKIEDNAGCFHLLGDSTRFYQVRKAKRLRTVNDLLQELPAGNNFWHFRHSTDGKDGLCPACCALGLLRLPMFSVSGLPDLKAGINGAPPVYVMRVGATLQETLMLNWTPHRSLGTPAWLKPDITPEPGKSVPLLTGLTLLSRRVWLHEPTAPGTCIACGTTTDQFIVSCESESAGEQRSERWDDPHVVYTGTDPRRSARAADLTKAGMFKMDRPWPYLLAEIIASGRFTLPGRPLQLLAVGFATDKAKNIDVWERTMRLPSTEAIAASARVSLEQWYGEAKGLERRASRSENLGKAVMTALRPGVEGRVSSRTDGLLSTPDASWAEAASAYRPLMQAAAQSLSPGVTTEAVHRRMQIADSIPDMRPRERPAVRTGKDKRGKK